MKLIANDVNGNEYAVTKEELSWRPGAYGVLIKDGKILLSPQFKAGAYDLPGGGAEIDESLEEAVVREFREETGLTVRAKSRIGFGDNLYRSSYLAEPKSYHAILAFFECEYVNGEITTSFFDGVENEYMSQAEWVDISTLDQIKVASSFDWRGVVKQFINGLQHGN